MKFLAKLALFMLPVAIPFLLVTGGLVYIGESMPLQEVIRLQESDWAVLFRPTYGNRDQDFKLMSTNARDPEILIIGSSRVLQFRGQLANLNPDAIYNAAAPAWELEEVSRLLFNMETAPEVIILGIDYPWFNDDYPGDPIVEPPTNWWSRLFVVNRSYLQEVIAGDEFAYETILNRDEPGGSGGLALGLRAIRDGHGFRNDGSEQYGDFLVAGHLWQPNLRGHHMGLFERGEEMYFRGDIASETALSQLEAILEFAQENDILVVGMLPPYMPTLWTELSVSNEHTYIPQTQIAIDALFADYDYPLFDFSDVSDLGFTDEDFFDGWHHSEKVSIQLYIEMATEIASLAQYSDLDALQEIVDTAPDTFAVLPFVAP
ncbi:MAG: hypothetical protein Phog2KO_11520 [Phototrophicaceae bacterium]